MDHHRRDRWPSPSGELRLVRTPGESYYAFIPDRLVGQEPWRPSGKEYLLADEARGAVSRLDGLSSIVPDERLFISMYLHKEALLSAQIEGTQSSLSDVLLFEEASDDSDAVEVVDYVAALRLGLERMKSLPPSMRLFNEVHERLLRGGRGRERRPGAVRSTQNRIGGTRPGNARFVPPPADELGGCLADLERYLNDAESEELPLVRIARAHVQLETIHPYLDGNGRLGRLLITLCLIAFGVVGAPLLYMSLYLKSHRETYYELLQRVRTHGDWRAWILFFLEGVRETAMQATDTAERIRRLLREDQARIAGRSASSRSLPRLHALLQRTPIVSVTRAAESTGMSHPTAMKGFETLAALGLVQEITGRRRGLTFAYGAYLSLFQEGTDPLPRS